jgi:hypothetical protein
VTVHSTQLGKNATITTAGSTLYTVPAGKRTIVKGIGLQNLHSAAQTVVITLAGIDVGVWLTALNTDGAGKFLEPWIVLNAGDHVQVSPLAGNCEAIIAGSELIL